jgi:riboflavin kinase, archaea type
MDKKIKPHLWFTLYNLLTLGGGKSPVKVSTTELSRTVGGSQQSASRHLQTLEEMGLLTRRIGSDGSVVALTEAGFNSLQEVLQELKLHLEGISAEVFVFEGKVVSGLFEGAYYIGKDGYKGQIREKLGFDPFPGTLNLKINTEDFDRRRKLERNPSAILEGFINGERSFGACKLYSLLLNNEVKGALIVADRTIHDLSVMEIISPVYLRRHFGLADGDLVKVSFLSPRRFSV